MANWWEEAPLAEQQNNNGGNWWEQAPLASRENNQPQGALSGGGALFKVVRSDGRTVAVRAANEQEAKQIAENSIAGAVKKQAFDQPFIDQQKAQGNSLAFSALASAGQGLTFNLMDEAVGAVGTLPTIAKALSPFHDEKFSDIPQAYRDNKLEAQDRFDSAREYAPKTYFAGEIGGSVVGAGKLLKGATMLPKVGGAASSLLNTATKGNIFKSIGANAVIGSGLGALDAYGRDHNIAEGAALGGVGGAVGGAAFRGANAIWNKAYPAGHSILNRLTGQRNGAMKKLDQALANDGLDYASAAAKMQELGPNAMMMDIGGTNLQGYAGALANMPGKGYNIIRNALGGRNANANQRILGGVDDILGKTPQPSAVLSEISEGQKALQPAYQDALRQARPVDTQNIASFLDDAMVSSRGGAQKQAKDMRSMLNEFGKDTLDNNPRTLLEVRKAIDGKLANELDPNAIRMLSETRNQVDALLAKNVNGIKAVDGQYQALAQQKEAFEQGGKVFATGKTALRPEEVASLVKQGAVPNSPVMGPSAQPLRAAQGARVELDRMFGTAMNDKSALQKAVMGEGDWNRQKLGLLFGQDKTNRLAGLLNAENTFANTSNNVMGNSATAGRGAFQRELGGGGIIEEVADKGIFKSIYGKVGDLIHKLPGVNPDKRNELLAKALTGDYQSTINMLSTLQKQGSITTPQINAIMGAIWGATATQNRKAN